MIALDTEKIRTRAQAACERAAAAFAAADHDLRMFEREDVPAFHAWRATALGPLMSEFQRYSAEFEEQARLYDIAMAESMATGLPPGEALQHWREKQERKRLQEARRGPKREPDPLDDDDASFEELLEDMFEPLDEEWDEPPDPRRGARGPGSGPETETAHRPSGDRTLRDVYRKLCRLLHPDAAGELSAERREVWHQVQDAYATGDVDRLENILARLSETEGALAARRSRTVAELLGLQRHYQRAKQKLGNLLREARRHPAWQFHLLDASRRAMLARRMTADIHFAISEIRRDLATIRRELQPQSSYLRGRRRASRADDFLF